MGRIQCTQQGIGSFVVFFCKQLQRMVIDRFLEKFIGGKAAVDRGKKLKGFGIVALCKTPDCNAAAERRDGGADCQKQREADSDPA